MILWFSIFNTSCSSGLVFRIWLLFLRGRVSWRIHKELIIINISLKDVINFQNGYDEFFFLFPILKVRSTSEKKIFYARFSKLLPQLPKHNFTIYKKNYVSVLSLSRKHCYKNFVPAEFTGTRWKLADPCKSSSGIVGFSIEKF